MALKLRRLGTRNQDIDDQPVQSADVKGGRKRAETWYGRPVPPPAHGGSYFDFLDWASGEALDPSQADVDLAIALWSGRVPIIKECDDETPKMKM